MLISTSFLFMDSIRENVHDSQSNIEQEGLNLLSSSRVWNKLL